MRPADVAVVVPALNEAANLRRLLPLCRRLGVGQLVVADGGSVDNSIAVAGAAGATWVTAPRGRGTQLRAGVAATSAPVIWVLHADATPPAAPFAAMGGILDVGRAGAFRLRIDGKRPAYRLVELGAALRTAATGIPYGDQGMFFTRAQYERAGGFPEIPFMEDVALAQALRRAGVRFRVAPASIGTSARRWERDGVWRRTLKNWSLALRFQVLNVPAERLAAEYPPEPAAPGAS